MIVLILLGAEGVMEVEGVPWIRDTSPDELETFKEQHRLSAVDFEELCIDETGRPYFLMALLHDAPAQVRTRAQGACRLRRLYP